MVHQIWWCARHSNIWIILWPRSISDLEPLSHLDHLFGPFCPSISIFGGHRRPYERTGSILVLNWFSDINKWIFSLWKSSPGELKSSPGELKFTWETFRYFQVPLGLGKFPIFSSSPREMLKFKQVPLGNRFESTKLLWGTAQVQPSSPGEPRRLNRVRLGYRSDSTNFLGNRAGSIKFPWGTTQTQPSSPGQPLRLNQVPGEPPRLNRARLGNRSGSTKLPWRTARTQLSSPGSPGEPGWIWRAEPAFERSRDVSGIAVSNGDVSLTVLENAKNRGFAPGSSASRAPSELKP